MPVDLEYAFAFTPPAGRLVAHMKTVKAGSVRFDATLSLERRPWNAAEIRRALVRYPAMTATVMAGIHWQALRLWWKGVPVVRRLTGDGVGERAAARPRRPAGPFGDGAMSMVTSGQRPFSPASAADRRNADRGVPDRACGAGWRVGCGPDGPRRTVLPPCADRQRHRPRSFMDGDWTTPDPALVRLMLRNRRVLEGQSRITGALRRLAGGGARRLRDNSLAGSRRHIHRHYDLGNEFFRLFLDADLLMYSCGYFESAADALEQAQAQKVDRICRTLRLLPTDHVLEIGSGWGGFAVWAATRYGCRVTTTTISDEQYRHVCDWRSRIGGAGARIEVLRADYRELAGRFDKVVSIEMFEAVGLSHYDQYFTAVDRLLAPDGVMFLQTITVDDQWFPQYHGTPDWIEKYIFPGGELASVGEMLKSLARTTSLSLYHAENAAPTTPAPCRRGGPASITTSRECFLSDSMSASSACGTCTWDRAKRRFSNATPDCFSCCC
jgi:cyclopropane fatty-acyl-phospholipid synthase-like methyltransferase